MCCVCVCISWELRARSLVRLKKNEPTKLSDAYISLSRLMAAIFGGWQFSFAEGLINQSLLLLFYILSLLMARFFSLVLHQEEKLFFSSRFFSLSTTKVSPYCVVISSFFLNGIFSMQWRNGCEKQRVLHYTVGGVPPLLSQISTWGERRKKNLQQLFFHK